MKVEWSELIMFRLNCKMVKFLGHWMQFSHYFIRICIVYLRFGHYCVIASFLVVLIMSLVMTVRQLNWLLVQSF